MRSVSSKLLCVVTASIIFAPKVFGQIDPNLNQYQPSGAVSGLVKTVGSDTMNNLMALWGESFKTFYPNVQIEIEGKGSSTAPPALKEGQSTFGPMSRPMKKSEIDSFESSFGYKPVGVRSAIDMLAVYVHKDNPIAEKGLTLEQIDSIFSKSRNFGGEAIQTWGDLGLTGEWAKAPISLYGRNSASGTYGYFKSVALKKGDYLDTVKEQPGSSAVIQGVARDKFAIGYSGIGYKTADVKTVPVSPKSGEAYVKPSGSNASKYPISRFLLVYVNKSPKRQLPPLQAEFLRFMLSKQGQDSVVKDGFISVPASVAEADLRSLGL